MQFFAKVEKFYARIGDKASFAYTVWSMATVHKMRDDYKQSTTEFARARQLLRETRDHRRLISCRLGIEELVLLQDKQRTARKAFTESLEKANSMATRQKPVMRSRESR